MLGAVVLLGVECELELAGGGHAGLLVVECELELARDGNAGVSATQEPAEQADELLNRSDLEVVEGADESVSQLEAEDVTEVVEGKRAQRLPSPSSWRQSWSDSPQKDPHCSSGCWAGC